MAPFLLMFGLLLAGCATTGKTTILTPNDTGRTVPVAPGMVLELRLPANPSTGYDWQASSVAAPALKFLGSTFVPTPTGMAMTGESPYVPMRNPSGVANTGAGGTDIFRFRAVEPGQQVLQFNYIRSWEKGTQPAQTVSFTVQVASKP